MGQASCPQNLGVKPLQLADLCTPFFRYLRASRHKLRATNYEPQGAGSTVPSYRKHPEGKGMGKGQRMGKSEGGRERAPCPSEKPAASPRAGPLPLLAVQHKDPRSSLLPVPPSSSQSPFPTAAAPHGSGPCPKTPPTPSPGTLPWAGARCQCLWGRDPRLAPQGAAAAGQPGRCSFGKHPALGIFIYLFIFKINFLSL